MTETPSMSELCERIRTLLARDHWPDEIEAASLARQYSDMASKANQRIRRAVEWLRKGLRAEAIHHVEQWPDALEVAAALELGYDKERWLNACSAHGLYDVASVDAALAGELSAAYQATRGLPELLAQFRRHSLAVSPLPVRLATLAQLAQADPGNPVWAEQRTLLEKARLNEMLRVGGKAVKTKDIAAVEALIDELAQGKWSSAPPARLIRTMQEHHATLLAERDRDRLGELCAAMHDAFGRLDEPVLRSLMMEWQSIMSAGRAAPEPEAAGEVEAVSVWLDSRDADLAKRAAHENGLADLQHALDEQMAEEEIERLYARLALLELPIPTALERRYQIAMGARGLDRRRRHRLQAAALVGALAITAGLVAYILLSQARARTAESWSAQVAAALDAGDTDNAGRLLKELDAASPAVSRLAELQALRARFEEADAERLADQAAFTAALAALTSMPGDEPGVMDLLARAESLARTEQEKSDVLAQRGRLEDERRAKQAEIDLPFQQRRQELVEAHRAIAPSDPERERRLADLLVEFDELMSMPGISEPERAAGAIAREATEHQLSELRRSRSRDRQIASSLDDMKTPTSRGSEVGRRLRDFVDRFPETAEAARIAEALRNAPAWESADAYAAAYAGWNGELSVRTADEATARLAVIAAARGLVDASMADAYRDYLTQAATMTDPDESLGLGPLRDLLKQSWLENLSCVRGANGSLYYSLGGVVLPGLSEYSIELTERVSRLADLAPDAKRGKNLIDVPKGSGEDPGLLTKPLAGLAKRMQAEIVRFERGEAGWESLHARLAVLVAGEKDLDPILKLSLITDRLTRHITSGWPPAPEAATFTERVLQSNVGGNNLVDLDWPMAPRTDVGTPAEREVVAGRAIAAKLIDGAPNFAEIAGQADREFARFGKGLAPLAVAGIVWPDESGNPIVRSWGRGEAFALTRSEQGEVIVVSIGTLAGDGIQWKGAPPALGSPVFVRAQR